MPLRILVVTNRIPWPLNDGGNIATYHVLEQLVRRGHHVELASLNTQKHSQDPKVLAHLLKVHSTDIDTTVKIGGMLKGIFEEQPYNVGRFWSKEFAGLLRKILKASPFDIVQFEGSYLGLYAKVVHEFPTLKLVLRSHNVEHVIWSRLAEGEKNPLKRLYLKSLTPKIERFEKEHVQDFHGIVPIASQDEVWYHNQGFKGILRTITGGVDLLRFSSSPGRIHPFRVAFLGSLEWLPNRQGLDWFLDEVWPELRRRHPDWRMDVAGKNPPRDYLAQAPEGVEMHGEVADAADYLRLGGVFVVPLLAGGGMRMKILEAMAAGLCVVSTTIGAEGIPAIHQQQIVIADTADEWIQSLSALMADPAKVAGIGAAGRKLVESGFGWEAIGNQFETFYAELLK